MFLHCSSNNNSVLEFSQEQKLHSSDINKPYYSNENNSFRNLSLPSKENNYSAQNSFSNQIENNCKGNNQQNKKHPPADEYFLVRKFSSKEGPSLHNSKPLMSNTNNLMLQLDNSVSSSFFNNENSLFSYREILNYFTSVYLCQSKDVSIQQVDSSGKGKKCCLIKLLSTIRKKIILDDELIKEKNLLLFISSLEIDMKNPKHLTIIKTIYEITQIIAINYNTNEHKKLSHNEIINYYNKIKIISNNNVTCFDLMQIIALYYKHPSFLEENIKLNLKGNLNDKKDMYFDSLMKYLICFSNIVIRMLKENVLDLYVIKNKSVVDTLNEFYFGIIMVNIEEVDNALWEKQNIINLITLKAKNSPSSILWKYYLFKEKYPEMKDSVSNSFQQIEMEFSR